MLCRKLKELRNSVCVVGWGVDEGSMLEQKGRTENNEREPIHIDSIHH